jgi:hypothetical protein
MHGGVAGVGRQLPPLCRSNRLLVQPVSRIAEEFHLVSHSSESSTEYRCKFSLKSALQYEIALCAASQIVQSIAPHDSARTIGLYDRRSEEVAR